MNDLNKLNIKHFAHIGDACWELYIRNKTVYLTGNLNKLHKLTVSLVNASFQTKILEKIKPCLNDEELDLAKRGGNIKTGRRINRNLHRTATELEVLVGFLYLFNKERLCQLQKICDKFIDEELSNYSDLKE